MIYLETNALRILANRLHCSNFVQDKYTSVLSIIELLSGIKDEKEYKRRRGIIKKIVESEIYTHNRIHPLLPASVIAKSFGIPQSVVEQNCVVGIIGLLKIVVAIPCYNSFINLVSQDKELEEFFYFTQNFDDISGKYFISLMTDKSKNTNTEVLIPEFKVRWEERDFESILYRVVHYYASKISNNMADGKTQTELVDAYDRSINPFLLAVSYYVDQKISLKNTVAKNDSIDLLHLLYIRESDVIVSDDKLLHNILTIAYPNSILKASEI